MNTFKIYLSGGMMKFGSENFVQGNMWRVECRNYLEKCDSKYRVDVFNPNNYFSFRQDAPQYDSELEVMRFDLRNLKNSDLVVACFNDKYSLGTMSEIAIAYEKDIPVIGLNIDNDTLHPWQKCMAERIFTNINEMLEYIKDFYLT